MNCPSCDFGDSRVIDSRADKFLVRRRRECKVCSQRWTTYEMDTVKIESLRSGGPESASAEAALELITQALTGAQILLGQRKQITSSHALRVALGQGRGRPPTVEEMNEQAIVVDAQPPETVTLPEEQTDPNP